MFFRGLPGSQHLQTTVNCQGSIASSAPGYSSDRAQNSGAEGANYPFLNDPALMQSLTHIMYVSGHSMTNQNLGRGLRWCRQETPGYMAWSSPPARFHCIPVAALNTWACGSVFLPELWSVLNRRKSIIIIIINNKLVTVLHEEFNPRHLLLFSHRPPTQMLESCPINLETAVSPMAPEFKRADKHGTHEKAMLKKTGKDWEDLPGSCCFYWVLFQGYYKIKRKAHNSKEQDNKEWNCSSVRLLRHPEVNKAQHRRAKL